MCADDPQSPFYHVYGSTERLLLSWDEFRNRARQTPCISHASSAAVQWYPLEEAEFRGDIALPLQVGNLERKDLGEGLVILGSPACRVQAEFYVLEDLEKGAIPFFSKGCAHILRGTRYFECELWTDDPDEVISLDVARDGVRCAYLRGGWDETRWLVIAIRSANPEVVMQVLEQIDIRERQ
jgi:hypothetical protein